SFMQLSLVAFIASYALSAAAQFVIGVVTIVGRNSPGARGTSGARVLLSDGVKLLGLNLGQSLTYRSDTILLGVLSEQSEVGLYAVATTPAGVMRIPSN